MTEFTYQRQAIFHCALLSDSCPSHFHLRLPSLLPWLSLWADTAVIYSNSSSGAIAQWRYSFSRHAKLGLVRTACLFPSPYLNTEKSSMCSCCPAHQQSSLPITHIPKLTAKSHGDQRDVETMGPLQAHIRTANSPDAAGTLTLTNTAVVSATKPLTVEGEKVQQVELGSSTFLH